MSWKVEVFTYFALWLVVGCIVEMCLESVHQAVLCLSHILLVTTFAGEAVNQVRALTSDVVFGNKLPAQGVAFDAA